MTIELVDGHANKPHISGDDLGDFKAGILGNDGYVFNRANKLAATLNGSNSVTIATGSGILPNSGRHFRVTAPETLTITSGTQGQNRNDLCVVRASTSDDGTTVENAQLLILRGTPTSGTASDPETQEGDLVLYRFQLTGVSVAEPIALFDIMVPYNEFRDSISPVVLHNNPDQPINSDIELADDASNYSKLTIEFKDSDGYYSSIEISGPNGKNVCLNTIRYSEEGWFGVNNRVVNISGTSISTVRSSGNFGNTGQVNIISSKALHIDVITITKVIGWK